jgi:hypothetical protein
MILVLSCASDNRIMCFWFLVGGHKDAQRVGLEGIELKQKGEEKE